ncbi:MAG TPA: hemolysin III family protein [Pyrinomonadaceae bacterium]|nr:hemolysin III family protein [Pyrinomonadaceae bacterium]
MERAILKDLSVEEFANTITHGFGLILSLAGFAALVVMASLRGDPLLIAGCVVYGLSLIVLYAASTIYHGTTSPELKHKLQLVDHCCIYLLIAGSYTPFGIIILSGTRGQSLLALIWTFAIVGITAKLLMKHRFPAISVVSYVVMGWLGVFAVQPMLETLGTVPVLLAVAGGLSYTFGVIFFAWHRIPHNHAIFHVFVLAGSILHYAAVILYVVPYSANL